MQNQKFNLHVKTLSGQHFTLVVAARDLNYIYYQIHVLMTQYPDSLPGQIEKGRFDLIEPETDRLPDPYIDRKIELR